MEGAFIGGLVRGGFEEGCEDKKRKLMLTSSDVISQEETNTVHSVSPKPCFCPSLVAFPSSLHPPAPASTSLSGLSRGGSLLTPSVSSYKALKSPGSC